VHEWQALVHAGRQATWTAALYGRTAVRVGMRGGRARLARVLPREDRVVFVVGCPRSGTTFTGGALGAQPGWVDLGELPVLKAAVPELVELPAEEQAARVRRIVQRVRTLAGVGGLRGVEQNPETVFVLPAALRGFPQAWGVHVLRDGRDVVCSLLERGWLRSGRTGRDDAGQSYGRHARFWVEPERREEFEEASEARRAAWAWRRYVSTARIPSERVLELRYEGLVDDPAAEAERIAAALDGDRDALARAFADAHGESVGRWRRDLTSEQLADVEAEAGDLLAALGYG
jgi:sulfotransferase family protein